MASPALIPGTILQPLSRTIDNPCTAGELVIPYKGLFNKDFLGPGIYYIPVFHLQTEYPGGRYSKGWGDGLQYYREYIIMQSEGI